MTAGLYLVGTPIGNLEDITLRALRTLREADRIACEDTRRTLKLLNHFEIRKPLVSCHEHNEHSRAAELVEFVRAGEAVALVSDAGMPGISDPGALTVAAMIEAGLPVVPVPGPTAVSTALIASGLPADQFFFVGFLPPKTGARKKALEALRSQSATLVIHEAPHRIVAALRDALDVLGDRPAAIGRELTKKHEEFLRASLSGLAELLAARETVKGEIVLLIGSSTPLPAAPATALPERVRDLIAQGASRMDAIKQAAAEHGIPKRESYRLVEEANQTPPDGGE